MTPYQESKCYNYVISLTIYFRSLQMKRKSIILLTKTSQLIYVVFLNFIRNNIMWNVNETMFVM